jgi:acyl-CoA synthetase (NDP forming)
VKNYSLEYLFYPKSIAIVGVSMETKRFNAGLKFLQSMTGYGYKGKIYPVNPVGGKVYGLKIYKSVREIPDEVDYVISAIPAQYTPQLVADAVAKGVKAMHFFTSGFSEIENSEGKILQAEILRIARKGGMRIIGPNCLGLHCPEGGISFNSDFSKKSGPVGLISQSGGNSAHCVHEGNARGVYFSKVVSMGNGADLNESDYLEYLISDPKTKIITAYIEGVREGPRFMGLLEAATKIKPVIVFKVGSTKSGAEAAASHTAALSGSSKIWESLLKQTGAIQVHSIEEMMDVTVALLRLDVPKGRNTVVIGVGGGASVIAADEFTNAGLKLPSLSDEAKQRLMKIYTSEAGRIFKNPIDINDFVGPEVFIETVKILEDCTDADLIAIQVAFDHWGLISAVDKRAVSTAYLNSIMALKGRIHKPTCVVLHSYATNHTRKFAIEARDVLTEAGFTVFPSIPRAANALNKFIGYQERNRRHLKVK